MESYKRTTKLDNLISLSDYQITKLQRTVNNKAFTTLYNLKGEDAAYIWNYSMLFMRLYRIY